jgi:dipeptidyl aminopeptidase/acylaminoacyl peptidase
MRARGFTIPVVAVLFILLIAMTVGGCTCAVLHVIDKASVTARGLSVFNEAAQKANDGYDVREARSKWFEALDAYNRGDYDLTNQLLDETSSMLEEVVKVGERLYYSSSDGLTVSGLLYRPTQGEGPWPTIIVNHAGFGTAGDFSEVGLNIRDHGYLVFNPDYRGSGESEGTYEGAKGEVDDVIYGIEYLKSLGLVEDDRIGLYGQSHGGAVSMIVAGRYPGIKAVVEEAGFSDAVGLYENAATSSDPNIRQSMDQVIPMVGGNPDQVPEEYEIRSAINYVDSIQAPMLIIHGEQDPLIPVKQAYEMYEALEADGKTVQIKIYPDEAHCVGDPVNRAEVWQLMLAWFDKYV